MATAIMPYVARAALSYPAAKRARIAYGTARRYAPRVAGFAARVAANRIGRAYRRYRRRSRKRKALFSRQSIGNPVGHSNAKRTEVANTGFNAQDSRTLYSESLTDMPFGQNIDERQRNIINYRGCQVCLEVRNERAELMYFNVAVLHRKDSDGAPSTADFFRGAGSDRGLDFANGRNSCEFRMTPINSDIYTVLRHKRYLIGPAVGATLYNEHRRPNYLTLRWYMKIKRQLRYNNNAVVTPEKGHVYLCYWCDYMGAGSGQAPLADIMRVRNFHRAYWRETNP